MTFLCFAYKSGLREERATRQRLETHDVEGRSLKVRYCQTAMLTVLRRMSGLTHG
jgi:hypothetical protein